MDFSAQLFGTDAFAAFLDTSPVPVLALVGGDKAAVETIAQGVVEAGKRQQPLAQRLIIVPLASPEAMVPKREPRPFDGRGCRAPLKVLWCRKHQTAVFGAVVVLVDWDDESNPTDRVSFQAAVLQRVEGVRAKLRHSPNTVVHLALYTTLKRGNEFPSAGGFNSVEEATVVLRHHCAMDQRQIFFLYRRGEDAYSISLLQRAVTDAALRYHREEVTRIKRLKSDIQRSLNPVLMLARHRFKCGWHATVAGDAKAALHNFEKSYNALRSLCANAPLSVRLCASIVKWHITSLTMAMALGTSAATTSPGSNGNLKALVQNFLAHMVWIEQPLSAVAPPPPLVCGGGSAAPNSGAAPEFNASVTSTGTSTTSPRAGESDALEEDIAAAYGVSSGSRPQHALMRDAEDECTVARLTLAQFIVEMYRLFATRLEAAAARGQAALLGIAGGGDAAGANEIPPSLNPGFHYQCAGKFLFQLRGDVLALCRVRDEMLANASAEDAAQAREAAGVPARLPPFLGLIEHLDPQALDRALLLASPRRLSEQLNEVLLMATTCFQLAGLVRVGHQLSLAVAENYLFSGEPHTCLNKLSVLFGADAGAGVGRWSWLQRQATDLAIRACRAVLAGGGSEEAAAPPIAPGHGDGHKPAAVEMLLMWYLLLLAGNRSVPETSQRIALDDVASLVTKHRIDRVVPLANPAGSISALLDASVAFGDAYLEAASGQHTTLRVCITSTSAVPIAVVGVSALMAAVGAALGPNRQRAHVPMPQNTVHFLSLAAAEAKTAAAAAVAASQVPPRFVSARKPLELCTRITFAAAAMIACTELHVALQLPVSSSSTSSSLPSLTGAPTPVLLRVSIPVEAPQIYHRFEHRKYDHQLDCVSLPRPDVSALHRPLLRVVPPVPQVTIESFQGAHAVEGEDYEVLVRITSTGDSVDAGLLSIPFLHGMVEVVDHSTGAPSDAPVEPLYMPAPVENPERPYCIHQLRSALCGVGSVYEHRIVFRCTRAGKFELPLRLDYATPKCATMTLHHTVRLHVCHPVFAYVSVFDTATSGRQQQQQQQQQRPGAGTPQAQGGDAADTVAVPSLASGSLFIESSELRVEEVHHAPLASSFDGMLLQSAVSAAFGGFAGEDGNDANNGGEASADGAADTVAIASALAAHCPNPVAAQLYSVQRTQIPTESHGALHPLTLRCGAPFVMSCRFTNSLQCPITITEAHIVPPAADVLPPHTRMEVTHMPSAAALGLPCELGLDGEFTLVATSRFIGSATPSLSLGSVVLVLAQHAADGSLLAPVAFQMPLPEAMFVNAPLQLVVRHPDCAIVGRPFFVSCELSNVSSSAFAKVTVTLDPAAATARHRYLLGGRTSTTFSLAPGARKQTTLKIVPLASGPLDLPPIVAVVEEKFAAAQLARSEDIRGIHVFPADAHMKLTRTIASNEISASCASLAA